MKKMKILTLLLCASLAFAYMGCSNSSGGSDSRTSTPSGNNGNGTPGGAGGSGNNGGGITPKLPTAISAGENGTAGTSGTYVYFGEWPKTLLEDNSIIDESVTKTVGMFTYFKGGNDWYAKIEANSYNTSDTYYKVEPIKWRVLNPAATGSERKMLLAENILINCAYYDFYNVNRTIGDANVYPNNYEHSRVRAFLNGLGYQKNKASDSAEHEENNEFRGKGFLQTAFTEEELAAIATTTVVNNVESTVPDEIDDSELNSNFNGGVNQYASDDTTSDKIFLLSEQEVTKADYGFAAYDANGIGNTRIRMTTAFARANGASQNSTEGYAGYWWLRSPDYDGRICARGVHSNGSAGGVSLVSGDYLDLGVVPALCLN